MGRDITQCHPRLQSLAKKLIQECANQGLKIAIGESFRSVAEQDALYAQGRTKPGNIVTNAKGSSYSSMHQWGVAFDIYRNDGRGNYNESGDFFTKVGHIGVSIGLEWGGNWRSIKDKPHFQLPDWGSTPKRLKSTYGNFDNFKKTWGTAPISSKELTPAATPSISSEELTPVATISVTAEQLKKFGWRNVYDHVVRDLNLTLQKYDINTPARIRHFLSQCAHESGLGKWTKELADGRLYEFRRGLGNVNPGDGPKYKGAGYLQLTGRSNYQQFANEMDDPRIMEGVEYVSKNYPWTSAGHFWKANNINALIDSGASVRAVTKVINPALRGLSQREEYYRRFAGLVASTPTQGGPVNTTARRVGRLIPPRTPSQGQAYKVQQGESLWDIARKYRVSVDVIKKANPGINEHNLPVGKVLKISNAGGPVNPPPQVQTYKVKQGESLWDIAQKYHVSVDVIKKANPGINEHNLPVGKELKIPSVRVPGPSYGSVNISWINNNHQTVWNFFKSKGFSDGATAGIMGNLQHESHMDPKSKQYGGGPGRGLCQWESSRGGSGRWDKLVARAKRFHPNTWKNYVLDLNFQLEFLWYELNGGDSYTKSILDKKYGGIKSLMRMGIDHAVVAFQESFERANPSKVDYPSRKKYAYAIYNRFAQRSGVRRAMG